MYYDQSLHFYGQVQQPIGLAPSPSDYNYLPSLITSVLKNASTATRTRTTTTHPGRCSLSYHADDLFSVWNPFDQSRFDLTACFKYSLYLIPFLSILIIGSVDLYKLTPPTGHPAQVDQPNSDQTVQTNLHHQIGSDSRRLSHPHAHQTSFIILRSSLIAAIFILECLGPFKYDDNAFCFGKDGYEAVPQDDQADDSANSRLESPLIYANVFSRLTFGWMTPMMKLGKSQHLTEDDLWPLPRADQADALTNRLHQTWRRQLSQTPSSPSLIYAIAQAYGGPYLLAALFKLIQDMLQFTQPQLLRRLLSFADSFSPGNQPEPAYHGYLIAGLMFGCGLIQTLFLHQYFDRTIVTGIRVRSGLIGVIYQEIIGTLKRGKIWQGHRGYREPDVNRRQQDPGKLL
ncbi:hypothetical protein Pst134EA_031302 [Puccinia striiformis f. sp. tritici]|uniref:uncharacterized protein n=1 Tax=Puccinia striiformis f. sp. tritici TaxID=168172 RepID=UPI0020082234|nr:uncharacterized protein Pst134EA_031302 [Puccinia striiformis f. sp. tritici]KAH9445382.1 hypothetical protein Pst134EA_031302 [Puccinia striiformis f. sp. tritici]